MKYIIKKKYVTEAKYAVDHKRHVGTTYYAGCTNLGGWFGVIENWGKRKDAVVFDNKKRALHMLKVLNEDGAEIMQI